MRSSLLLTALFLFRAEARAEILAECEDLESLKSRVTQCSFDDRAVESATACYEKTVTAWKEQAPTDLDKILSIATERQHTRQKAEFVFNHTDYYKTINTLWDLIYTTDRNAELVSHYSTAMRYDSHIETTCYSENFAALQEVVKKFDARLKEGLDTLEAARALRAIAVGRDDGVDSKPGNTVLRGTPAEGSPVPVPAGISPRPGSDITGIREEQEKEALSPFPLRDQLTPDK